MRIWKINQKRTILPKLYHEGLRKSMAAKTRYEDGEMYGVLLPYFCGVEGMERRKQH